MSVVRSSSFDSVRIALRTLGKQPGFTAVVVLSLALAIALNTIMYGVLDALVSPRVDVRRPDDVYKVQLFGDYGRRVSTPQRDAMVRDGLRSIEQVAWASGGAQRRLIEAGSTVTEGSVKVVSADYFDLIGPRLIAGRTFVEADRFATPTPIMLGEQAAATLFPGRDNPLGERVTVGDTSFVVIGVLSRFSDFADWRSSAWTLGTPYPGELFSRVIRLRPGTSVTEVERDLGVIAARIAIAAGEPPRNVGFRFKRPAEPQFHVAGFHIGIGLAVVAVLLVACANLANMQIARGITRRRELALRTALGATRARIIRHLLTESALLAGAGLVLGIVLTFWGMHVLRAAIPPAVGAYIVEPQLSWRVFVFAMVAAVACIVIVGLIPAMRVSHVDPNEMLKSGAGTGATRRHRREYGFLVVAEIALALALLCGATLMVRTALIVPKVMSYDPTPIVRALIAASPAPFSTPMRPTSEVLQSAAARLRNVPGVAATAASAFRKVKNDAITVSDSGRGVREVFAAGFGYTIVTPDYLRVLGLPIVRGRDFRDGERDEAGIIVDEYTAAGIWPGSNPIGAHVKLGDAKSNAPFVRVIGVTGFETQRVGGLPTTNIARFGMIYYVPGPRDSMVVGTKRPPSVVVVARASGDGQKIVPALRHVGAVNVHAEGDEYRRRRQSADFVARMFSLFAALGLALAAFGVYGVVAHSVAERRREFGVRIALGANARDILRAVLRESVVIALLGVAVGLLFTKYGVMFLAAFTVEYDVYNAPLFAGVAVFLSLVAAASALIPALRATQIDPTESLRSE